MKKQKNIIVKIAGFVSVCLFFAGCTIVALEIYSQSFGRIDGFRDGEYYTYLTWNEIDQVKYSREEVGFNSDGNRLQGFIYGRENNNGLVVISQGLGGSADSYFPMIMYFVDNGWRVFSFNNTGVGGSEGESARGLTQSLIDLDAALTYIESSSAFSGLSVMLAGHSWGGYAVCAVLNYNHRVNAVVSFAGFNISKEVFEEQGKSMVGGVYYLLSPQMWAMEKQLFGNTSKITAVDGINKSGIPVMIVQSSDDDVITPSKTSIYAHRAKINNPRVEIVFLDGDDAAGHEFPFSSKAQREYRRLAQEDWERYKAGLKNFTNADLAQWAKEYNFDKVLANELDADLMKHINEFFNNAK